MVDLNNYLQDGACSQARSTLMFLQGKGEIEDSWSDEYKRYLAELKVARWENCREQGYITSLSFVNINTNDIVQLNIAFFEHRNSDAICAIKWEQLSVNSLTMANAKFTNVYKDKDDVSFNTPFEDAKGMAEWIFTEFEEFWKTNNVKE